MKIKMYAVMTGYCGCSGSACNLEGLFKTREEAVRELHSWAEYYKDAYPEDQWIEGDSYEEYSYWGHDNDDFGNIQEVEVEIDFPGLGGDPGDH